MERSEASSQDRSYWVDVEAKAAGARHLSDLASHAAKAAELARAELDERVKEMNRQCADRIGQPVSMIASEVFVPSMRGGLADLLPGEIFLPMDSKGSRRWRSTKDQIEGIMEVSGSFSGFSIIDRDALVTDDETPLPEVDATIGGLELCYEVTTQPDGNDDFGLITTILVPTSRLVGPVLSPPITGPA